MRSLDATMLGALSLTVESVDRGDEDSPHHISAYPTAMHVPRPGYRPKQRLHLLIIAFVAGEGKSWARSVPD